MATPEMVTCSQYGGAAIVKATLPAMSGKQSDQPKRAKAPKPRQLVYCPRCGMRSQPAAKSH